MADWTPIADSALDPDAPVTSELAYAWRDNPIAITEGASGAPRIRSTAIYLVAGTVAGSQVLPSVGVAAGATAAWYALCDGSVRCVSSSATGTGGGVTLSVNGTNVASLTSGQSFNNLLTLNKNDVIRVISTGGTSVLDVTFRTSLPSIGLAPHPFG